MPQDDNKIDIENPKTKTDYEMRDFSWQNIRGWFIIIGIVYLASKFYKKAK
jgi:hypothetical protein